MRLTIFTGYKDDKFWGENSKGYPSISGFAGYNFPIGPFVSGVEIDVGISSLEHMFYARTEYPFSHMEKQTKRASFWTAGLRGRLGYSIDRFLIYGAAGATVIGYKTTLGETKRHTGWSIGGGLDVAITDNWIGRAEYKYSDFGTDKPVYYSESKRDIQSLSLGIAYRFD